MVGGVVEAEGTGDAALPGGPVQGNGGVESSAEQDCDGLRSGHGVQRAVFRLVLGDGGELDAAACAEAAFDFHPCGMDGGDEVIEDAVDDLLVESRVVAIGGEVVFEGFRFYAMFRRAVGDGEVARVRLPGDGAEEENSWVSSTMV